MPRMLAVAAEGCIKENKTEKRAALALMLKCATLLVLVESTCFSSYSLDDDLMLLGRAAARSHFSSTEAKMWLGSRTRRRSA